MPLTFATPTPFAPGVNSAYGGAQQWSQDAPMLASLEENIAQQYSQGNALRAQVGLQSRALNQQGIAQAGNLNEASAESQNQLASSNYQANLAANTQLMGQEYNAQAQSGLQQQQAQLQSWLNNQDMTQKEQMHLTQQKNAVADINSAVTNGTLSPQEGQQAILKLKTGIDAGQQRLQSTMQKKQEMLVQQEQQKGQAQAAWGEVQKQMAANGVGQTTTPVIDGGIKQKYADEFDAQNLGAFRQQQQAFAATMGAAMPAAAEQKYKQARDAYAYKKTLLDPQGIVGHQIQTAPGKAQFVEKKREKPQAADEPEMLLGDAANSQLAKQAMAAAEAQAKLEVPIPVNEDGKPQDTNEQLQKRNARAQAIYADKEKVYNEGVSARNKLRGKGPYLTGDQGQQTASPMTPQAARKTVADMAESIRTNTAIPGTARFALSQEIEMAKKAVEQAGGYDKLSPEWKKHIQRIGDMLTGYQQQYPSQSALPPTPPQQNSESPGFIPSVAAAALSTTPDIVLHGPQYFKQGLHEAARRLSSLPGFE